MNINYFLYSSWCPSDSYYNDDVPTLGWMKIYKQAGFVVGIQFKDINNQIVQWVTWDREENFKEVYVDVAGRTEGEGRWIETGGPVKGFYFIDGGRSLA